MFQKGSFFPVVSSAKCWIDLKYTVDLGPCRELNGLMKKDTFDYQATKKLTFTLGELTLWIKQHPKNPGEIQETLLALFSFFGFGRSVEVNKKEGSVGVVIQRCAKSSQSMPHTPFEGVMPQPLSRMGEPLTN